MEEDIIMKDEKTGISVSREGIFIILTVPSPTLVKIRRTREEEEVL